MIQFTDEQMRKLIKEETEKFLNSPYDESFDLVLEKKSKRQRKKQAQRAQNQKITQAQQAATAAKKAETPMDLGLEPDKKPAGRTKSQVDAAAALKAPAGLGGTGGTPAVDPAVAKNMAAANKAGQRTPAAGGGGGAGGSTTTSQASPGEPKPNTQQQAVATTEHNASAPAAAKQTWGDKLKQAAGTAAGAAKKGFDKFRASDINQKGGEAILDLGKRTAAGLAKAGIGTAGAIGKGVGAAAGDALGGTVKGLAKGVKGAIDMFRATPLQKMAKKAKKAGLGAAEIAKLHQAHQVGALSEKQIATLKLMERCLKSGKVKIIKEDKDPIIIDV